MRTCPNCGCDTKETANGKPRSRPQLRRYFAMVKAIFHHWPETAEVQFSSDQECRKYLQMKAGWREIGARVPLVGVNKAKVQMIVEAAIRGSGSYAMPVVHKNELIVWVPKSIAFHSMGPQEFGLLSDAVAQVAEQMTGLNVEELMRETERAA